ncbi:MAG: hemolysin III family protein [Gemmatimonadales bacterium]|nr:MAG: hemolysin III family protein [Gemmatimonadales bacterium]
MPAGSPHLSRSHSQSRDVHTSDRVRRARHRMQTLGEEIANSVSHGTGFIAAAVAAPFLVGGVAGSGRTMEVVAASVFVGTVLLAYLASTLYHAFPWPRAKATLRKLDHASIFLLIAGSYTPFTLGVLRGGWGWTLFGMIWTLALAGVLLKTFGGLRFPRLSLALYLGMGWLVVVAIVPLVQSLPPAGLAWLVGGGLAYTVGVIFYARDHFPYSHFIWHLFVLAGTVCHFVAVAGWAMP